MDGNGETTIFYVMIWNHPVETTIKKLVCLEFQVIHNFQRQRIFRLKKKNTNPSCLPFQETNKWPWKIHHFDGIYQDLDGDFRGLG